jgi:hypothetical protein
MEIYKSDGYRGRVYYVFDRKKNPSTAIIEAAHASKNSRENMITIPVWVNGMDLYLEPTKGAIKALAVVRTPRKGK